MSEPKTLLQLAGAPMHPSPWEQAALVIIDAQNEYTTGLLPLTGVTAAVAETRKLLDTARAKGTPVIHVVHVGKPGGAFNPEGPGGQIVPELTPNDGETIVRKGLPNAFAGTDLVDKLKATGRKELIIAGFMTHMCVSATARAALDHGYRATVVADACATRDLPDPLGGVIKAEQLHRAALTELADRFSVIAKNASAWG